MATKFFGERLHTLNTLGTPGVYRVVNSWVDGPPALGHTRTVLFTGTVVSTKMQKTINVEVSQFRLHPKLKQWVRTTTKLMAHDEWEEAEYGDIVDIKECRPLSKRKRFVLHRIVKPRMPIDWSSAAEVPTPLTYRTIAEQMRDATATAGDDTSAAALDQASLATEAKEGETAKEAYDRKKASYATYRRHMQRRVIARK